MVSCPLLIIFSDEQPLSVSGHSILISKVENSSPRYYFTVKEFPTILRTVLNNLKLSPQIHRKISLKAVL
ncbi:MAG: hypothetical protein ACTSPD_18170 [Promethearchaeota archaeon]